MLEPITHHCLQVLQNHVSGFWTMHPGWCSRKTQKPIALGVFLHTLTKLELLSRKAQINWVLTNTESTIWWAVGPEDVVGPSQG